MGWMQRAGVRRNKGCGEKTFYLVPFIIQNLRFVNPDVMSEKIKENAYRALGAIADYIILYGRESFNQLITSYFKRINEPDTPIDSFARRKRIFRINAALHGNLSKLRSDGRLIGNKFNPI